MDQGVPSSAMGARPSTATVVPARAYAAQTGIATAQEAIGGTSASTSAREAQQIRATVEGRRGRVAPPAIATADPVTTGNRAASSAQVGRRTRATDAGFVVLQGIACAMLATQAQRASGSARAAHSTHAMAAVRATTTRASAPATPLHTMALRAKMFVGAVPTVASVMRRGRVRASPDSSEIRAKCHVPSPPTGTRVAINRGDTTECATTPRSNAVSPGMVGAFLRLACPGGSEGPAHSRICRTTDGMQVQSRLRRSDLLRTRVSPRLLWPRHLQRRSLCV